jgi:Asp-tRNA(Asn)/Glu-tRNA(Gln) amidotransferase B subunit
MNEVVLGKALVSFQPLAAMATPTDHTHHIRIRSTQMEMPSSGSASRGAEDYDRKLREAQEELARIQQQQEELERKKQELEELTSRKRAFVSQQVELTEKLTSALTLIDRGLFEMRNETEDLEQCRAVFAAHLDKIQKFTPENWTRENLSEKLERATLTIDLAADEYEQAAAHFEGSRSGSIFGRASKRGRAGARGGNSGEFMAQFRNGLAFNLPILALGILALLVYLTK